MSEPRTEAGRALRRNMHLNGEQLRQGILAIEEQAADTSATIAALREALLQLDQARPYDDRWEAWHRAAIVLANTAEAAAQEKARIVAPWRDRLRLVHERVCGFTSSPPPHCDCGFLDLEARALLNPKDAP